MTTPPARSWSSVPGSAGHATECWRWDLGPFVWLAMTTDARRGSCARANRVGDGWAVAVDLTATRKAADVVKNREA